MAMALDFLRFSVVFVMLAKRKGFPYLSFYLLYFRGLGGFGATSTQGTGTGGFNFGTTPAKPTAATGFSFGTASAATPATGLNLTAGAPAASSTGSFGFGTAAAATTSAATGFSLGRYFE